MRITRIKYLILESSFFPPLLPIAIPLMVKVTCTSMMLSPVVSFYSFSYQSFEQNLTQLINFLHLIFRSHSLLISHCLLLYHFLHLYCYHHGLSHCYFIVNLLPNPLTCLPVSIFVSLQFIFNVTARMILLRCHSFAQNPALFPTVLRTKARAHVLVFKTLPHPVPWCLSESSTSLFVDHFP